MDSTPRAYRLKASNAAPPISTLIGTFPAIGLFAFVVHYRLLGWPFALLHEFVGRIDASLLRAILNFAGYQVAGFGTIVFRPSENFGIDIFAGCSSSFVAAAVIPGFVIAVLGLRGTFRKSDAAYLAGLLLITVGLNWLRLLGTGASQDGYRYWHDGNGASLLAAIYALLVLGAAYRATRDTVRGQVTR